MFLDDMDNMGPGSQPNDDGMTGESDDMDKDKNKSEGEEKEEVSADEM